jgi:hypothetical protein
MSFCAQRELVPVHLSMSCFCWSLKPRTVSRALIVRTGVRASVERLPLASLVGTSHLNLTTQRTSMTFCALLRGLRLQRLSLAQVCNSVSMAFFTSGQYSFNWTGVRMSSSLCTTTCRTVLGPSCNSTISPDFGFLGRLLMVLVIGGYTESSTWLALRSRLGSASVTSSTLAVRRVNGSLSLSSSRVSFLSSFGKGSSSRSETWFRDS